MIKVYYKDNCGQCKMVKKFLDSKGYEHEDIFVAPEDYGTIREKFKVEALPVTEFSAPYTDGFVVGANMGELNKFLKSAN